MFTQSWRLAATFITATLLAMSGLTTASAATFTSHASGAFAQTIYCDGSVCIDVTVDQARQQPNPFLFYDLTLFDGAGGWTDINGVGTIPKSSFTVVGNVRTLSIDTSNLGDAFANNRCSFDPAIGEVSCGPAPGGLIAAVFTSMHAQSSGNFSGTAVNRSPASKFVNSGTSNFSFASTNVNVLGTIRSNIGGTVGKNQSNTLVVELK